MSLYETSYGSRRADLRKLVAKIKDPTLARSDKEALLAKARKLAATLGLDLGAYNAPSFGAGV